MPQVSLYVDESTMNELRHNAALHNVSLSRYVCKIIKDHSSTGWPEGFADLYGSIQDESFTEPEELSFDLDARREPF